jgi:hypothetical protein
MYIKVKDNQHYYAIEPVIIYYSENANENRSAYTELYFKVLKK